MKHIIQNKIVVVDDEDDYLFYVHTWWITPGNHVYTTVNAQTILLHRVIAKQIDPNIQVHHMDNNGLNNQKSNFEIMTKKEHDALLSQIAQSNSKSGNVGVYFDKSRNRWRAQIRKKVLGSFRTKEEAIQAREKASCNV